VLEALEERVDRIRHRRSQRQRDATAAPVNAADDRER
jgi:hypothetical protein